MTIDVFRGVAWRAVRSAALALVCCGVLVACGRANTSAPVVGTLERHRMELAAYASEPVATLQVSEGQHVRAGQLLATLDQSAINARRAAAAAVLDQTRAQLAELVHGPRIEAVLEARARMQRTQVQLTNAEAEQQRAQQLLARKLISRSLFDERASARDQARAGVAEARAQLQSLLHGTRIEQLDQARAQLSAAQAQIVQIDVELARLQVRAPANGAVEALPYRVGERPSLGAPMVIMLADDAPFARVYVPEPLRAAFVPGRAVHVYIDGVPAVLVGHVRYVASQATFTPYFALTQKDRSHLAFVAEVDIADPAARALPVGVPLEVRLPP